MFSTPMNSKFKYEDFANVFYLNVLSEKIKTLCFIYYRDSLFVLSLTMAMISRTRWLVRTRNQTQVQRPAPISQTRVEVESGTHAAVEEEDAEVKEADSRTTGANRE